MRASPPTSSTPASTSTTSSSRAALAGARPCPRTTSTRTATVTAPTCAGTIGLAQYGVAKKATSSPSRCSAPAAPIHVGRHRRVLWAVDDAKKLTAQFPRQPALGRGQEAQGLRRQHVARRRQVAYARQGRQRAVTAGMHFGVAAGNENQDPATSRPPAHPTPSPSAPPPSRTSAPTSPTRASASTSLRPASTSSPPEHGNTSVNTISGTSMASPHIVGLLAYLLSIYGTADFKLLAGGQADHLSIAAVETRSPRSSRACCPSPPWLSTWSAASPATLAVPRPPSPTLTACSLPPSSRRRSSSSPRLRPDGPRLDTVNKLAFNNATSSPDDLFRSSRFPFPSKSPAPQSLPAFRFCMTLCSPILSPRFASPFPGLVHMLFSLFSSQSFLFLTVSSDCVCACL